MFLNFEFPERGPAAHEKFKELVAILTANLQNMPHHNLESINSLRSAVVTVTMGTDKLMIKQTKYEVISENNYTQIHYSGSRGSQYANSPTGIHMLDVLLPEVTMPEPWVYHPDVGDPSNIPWNMSRQEYFRSDLIDGHFLMKYLIDEITANGRIVTQESINGWIRLPPDAKLLVDEILASYKAIQDAVDRLPYNFEPEEWDVFPGAKGDYLIA